MFASLCNSCATQSDRSCRAILLSYAEISGRKLLLIQGRQICSESCLLSGPGYLGVFQFSSLKERQKTLFQQHVQNTAREVLC